MNKNDDLVAGKMSIFADPKLSCAMKVVQEVFGDMTDAGRVAQIYLSQGGKPLAQLEAEVREQMFPENSTGNQGGCYVEEENVVATTGGDHSMVVDTDGMIVGIDDHFFQKPDCGFWGCRREAALNYLSDEDIIPLAAKTLNGLGQSVQSQFLNRLGHELGRCTKAAQRNGAGREVGGGEEFPHRRRRRRRPTPPIGGGDDESGE